MSNVYQFPNMGRRIVVGSDWKTDFLAMANYMDTIADSTKCSSWIRAIAKETRLIARQ